MASYIKKVKTLTAREWHILQLLTSGDKNVDIAHELHRSEKTISQHIKNIEKKLNVENRVQLNKILTGAKLEPKHYQGSIEHCFLPEQLFNLPH